MAQSNLENTLAAAVKIALDRKVAEIVEEEIDKTLKRVRERITQAVGGVAIDTQHMVQFETMGHDLRITVKGSFDGGNKR